MTLWVILCAGFIPRGGENCGVIAEGETGGRLSAVFSAFKPRICIAFNLSDVISQKMPDINWGAQRVAAHNRLMSSRLEIECDSWCVVRTSRRLHLLFWTKKRPFSNPGYPLFAETGIRSNWEIKACFNILITSWLDPGRTYSRSQSTVLASSWRQQYTRNEIELAQN